MAPKWLFVDQSTASFGPRPLPSVVKLAPPLVEALASAKRYLVLAFRLLQVSHWHNEPGGFEKLVQSGFAAVSVELCAPVANVTVPSTNVAICDAGCGGQSKLVEPKSG